MGQLDGEVGIYQVGWDPGGWNCGGSTTASAALQPEELGQLAQFGHQPQTGKETGGWLGRGPNRAFDLRVHT